MMNIVFLITGLLFISLILIIFLSKGSIKSIELSYFKSLAIINLIGYIFELGLQFSIRFLGKEAILSDLLGRFYLLYFFAWFGGFSIYTFVISLNRSDLEKFNKEMSLVKKVILSSVLIGAILSFFLPQYIYNDGLKMYSFGPAVDSVKYAVFIYSAIWTTLLIKNLVKKNIFSNYYVSYKWYYSNI